MTNGEHILRQASITDDPVKRIAMTGIALTTQYYLTQWRKRKFYNPLLGETFEMVTDDYRFLAEKVQH